VKIWGWIWLVPILGLMSNTLLRRIQLRKEYCNLLSFL
jgi:hypothetical protein